MIPCVSANTTRWAACPDGTLTVSLDGRAVVVVVDTATVVGHVATESDADTIEADEFKEVEVEVEVEVEPDAEVEVDADITVVDCFGWVVPVDEFEPDDPHAARPNAAAQINAAHPDRRDTGTPLSSLPSADPYPNPGPGSMGD